MSHHRRVLHRLAALAPIVVVACGPAGSVPAASPTAPPTAVLWALVADSRLLRSLDRGTTWEERPLPRSPDDPRQPAGGNPVVSFVDDRDGWLLTRGSPATQCMSQAFAVWHTADAGATWERRYDSGVRSARCKEGLTFADGSRGWIATGHANGPPVVLRTADGGRTWTESRPLPDPPGFVGSGAGFVLAPGSVRVLAAALLVDAVGPSSGLIRRHVFRSTDGGASWTYAAGAPAADTPVAFVTATRWLQLAAPGQSMETADGGASWHASDARYAQAAPIAPVATFADADVGYATVRGGIQRTTDGGLHWSRIETPGTS